MRSREEVQQEIEWREKEIENLRNMESNSDDDLEYNRSRIQNLSFAIHWCKWFLNDEK